MLKDQKPAQVKESVTKQILNLTRETLEMSNNSLIELQRQEEILAKSQLKQAQIDDTLVTTDRALKSIESWWKQVINHFTPEKECHSSQNQVIKEEINQQKNLDKKLARLQHEYEADLTNLTSSTSKYHDEQERDLDETLLALKEIKLRAQQLNIVADASIERLDLFQTRTEQVTDKVKRQAKKAEDLAK
jgi:hypothetical protein